MQELEAFLNSIRRTYPFGIPRRLIDEVSGSTEKSQKLYLIGESLSEAGKALLSAAMEKGLKLSDYEIVLSSKDEVAEKVAGSPVIYFGTNSNLAAILLSHAKGFIKTFHPDDVVKDPSLKREFWLQIQRIIPELNK